MTSRLPDTIPGSPSILEPGQEFATSSNTRRSVTRRTLYPYRPGPKTQARDGQPRGPGLGTARRNRLVTHALNGDPHSHQDRPAGRPRAEFAELSLRGDHSASLLWHSRSGRDGRFSAADFEFSLTLV